MSDVLDGSAFPAAHRVPDQKNLWRLLTETFAFAQRNLTRLDRYVAHWPDGENAVGRLEDKIASECALLVLLARRLENRPARLDALVGETAALVAPIIRSARNRMTILRTPQAAASVGQGHIYLRKAGFGDPVWDVLVLGTLAERFDEIKERYPHRLLDRAWAQRLIGQDGNQDLAALMSYSIVRSRAHPFYMSTGDAYAYTHTLMYLTDFGQHAAGALIDTPRVGAVVDACLSWCLSEEDFDLLGEFLLTYVLLRQDWSAHAALAWDAIASVWDKLGFLPGPSFDEAAFWKPEDDARRAYAFQQLYHTNLVGGMLCAVLLGEIGPRTSRGPPSISAAPLEPLLSRAIEAADAFCGGTGSAAESAKRLTVVARDRHPDDILKGALERCRAASASGSGRDPVLVDCVIKGAMPAGQKLTVLLDGMTIGAVRGYDLPELGRCLRDMLDAGLHGTLTCRETIEFLLRQQVEDGAIGAPFVDAGQRADPAAAEVTAALASLLARARCLERAG